MNFLVMTVAGWFVVQQDSSHPDASYFVHTIKRHECPWCGDKGGKVQAYLNSNFVSKYLPRAAWDHECETPRGDSVN